MSPSLPDRARRRIGRLARRARAGSTLVTVVVDVRGAEPAARAAIDSVRNQSEPRLEILLVLVDAVLRPLAEDAARGDWRVRVVEAPGADPAAVRRLGAEHAKSPYLLFLSSRQQLLPGALPTLLAAREDARSAVVGRSSGPARSWRRRCSDGCSCLVSAWSETDDDGEPDGQVAALALLVPAHTSPSDEATLGDLGPVRPRPFEAPVDPIPGLDSRLSADRAMLDLARGTAPSAQPGLLARDLPPFLEAVERCDDDQWARLQAHTAELVRTAGAALADVPVEDRVLAWLACEDRRDDLVAYVASRRFSRGQFPTEVRDGLLRAVLERHGRPGRGARRDRGRVAPARPGRRRLSAARSCCLGRASRGSTRSDPQVSVTVGGRRRGRRVDRAPIPPSPAGWGSRSSATTTGRHGAPPGADCRGAPPRGGDDRPGSAPSGLVGELRLPDDAEREVAGPKVSAVELSPTQVAFTLDLPPGEELTLVGPGDLRLAPRREGTTWIFDLLADPSGLGTSPPLR